MVLKDTIAGKLASKWQSGQKLAVLGPSGVKFSLPKQSAQAIVVSDKENLAKSISLICAIEQPVTFLYEAGQLSKEFIAKIDHHKVNVVFGLDVSEWLDKNISRNTATSQLFICLLALISYLS